MILTILDWCHLFHFSEGLPCVYLIGKYHVLTLGIQNWVTSFFRFLWGWCVCVFVLNVTVWEYYKLGCSKCALATKKVNGIMDRIRQSCLFGAIQKLLGHDSGQAGGPGWAGELDQMTPEVSSNISCSVILEMIEKICEIIENFQHIDFFFL